MIIWDQSLSVGVKQIDEQHQHFIGILNQLSEMAVSKDLNLLEEIHNTLEALSVYANEHFSTEEKYFIEFNYDDAADHKIAHDAFRNQVKDFIKRKDEPSADVYDLYFKLLEFLATWLMVHIKEVDKKYIECFHKHGLH